MVSQQHKPALRPADCRAQFRLQGKKKPNGEGYGLPIKRIIPWPPKSLSDRPALNGLDGQAIHSPRQDKGGRGSKRRKEERKRTEEQEEREAGRPITAQGPTDWRDGECDRLQKGSSPREPILASPRSPEAANETNQIKVKWYWDGQQAEATQHGDPVRIGG